jgi:hypothetical protein
MIDLLDVEKFGFETIVPDTSYCVYGESEDTLFARSKTADGIVPAAEELSAETSHFRADEAAE